VPAGRLERRARLLVHVGTDHDGVRVIGRPHDDVVDDEQRGADHHEVEQRLAQPAGRAPRRR